MEVKSYLQKIVLSKVVAGYCFTQQASFSSNCTLNHPIPLLYRNSTKFYKAEIILKKYNKIEEYPESVITIKKIYTSAILGISLNLASRYMSVP